MRWIALLFCVQACFASQSFTLVAYQTTSRYQSNAFWAGDEMGCRSDTQCEPQFCTQMTGYAKFDTGMLFLPDTAIVTSMRLITSIQDSRHDHPERVEPPTIAVYYVQDDDWSMQGDAWIPYNELLGTGVPFGTAWEFDLNHDFSPDMADGYISVAFQNLTVPDCAAGNANNYVIYNGRDATIWDRPRLVVTYCDGCIADINNDLQVDILDLGMFLSQFGSQASDPWFDPEADFNRDQRVGLNDLTFVLSSFGENCCP